MHTRNLLPLLLGIVLMAATGCRTPPAAPHPARDPAVNFDSYRTFAVLPSATRPDLDPRTARAVTEAAERGARGALTKAGYVETNRESADLVFYLHGKALAPVGVTRWGYEPSPATFGISPAEVSKTSSSRLFVEAYDNRTGRHVWMDWVACTCRTVVPSRIENEIQNILEGFPTRAPNTRAPQAGIPASRSGLVPIGAAAAP